MICGNTSDFMNHPLSKYLVSAHGASHHAWAPGPTIWIRRWQKYKYSWGTSHRLWKNFKITHDSKISCNSLEGFPTLLLRKSNIQNFSVLDTITNGLQQNSILSRLKNLLKVCLHHLTATVS